MRNTLSTIVLLLLAQSVYSGEIEKIAVSCETGLCFYWWPKISDIEGWHHDRNNSLYYRFNALAPDGFSFSNAETVMYAQAIYKPRVPEQTFAQLVEDKLRSFEEAGYTTEKAGRLATADGMKLDSYYFVPVDMGNWEQSAYGEDDEYFYVFVLSSRSQNGFNTSREKFLSMIQTYQ